MNRPQIPNTMLGIAASSSIATAMGVRSQRGHVSVRNTAMPNAIGIAISIAITDVTIVP